MKVTKKIWEGLAESLLNEQKEKSAREALEQEQRTQFLEKDTILSTQPSADKSDEFTRFIEFGVEARTDEYLRQLAIIAGRASDFSEELNYLKACIEKIEQREHLLNKKFAQNEKIINTKIDEIEKSRKHIDFLEEKIKAQNEKIASQSKEIEALKEDLKSTSEQVEFYYDLVRGRLEHLDELFHETHNTIMETQRTFMENLGLFR